MTRRVAVLFGGPSGEHEVSLVSGEAVLEGLAALAHVEAVPVGITRDGAWWTHEEILPLLWQEVSSPLPLARRVKPSRPGLSLSDAARVLFLPGPGHDPFHVLRNGNLEPLRVDVVFPVLHGPWGEDGTVQGLLELSGLPYVGCDVAASALAMDKAMSRRVLQANGFPVLPLRAVRRADWDADRSAVLVELERLGMPLFVKPARLGSSVGISKVTSPEALPGAVENAFRHDVKIVAEPAVDAREIECAVLGNDAPRASLPGEIVPAGEFYDYRAKYVDEGSQILIPASLPDDTAETIRRMARDAFLALGCAGLARVDFLLDRKTGTPYVNELNTMPGFTPISMYPKLWEATGLPYPELLRELLLLAEQRNRQAAGSRRPPAASSPGG